MENNILLIETDLVNGLQHKCPICKKIVVFKQSQIGTKPKTRLVICNNCVNRLEKASFHRILEYLFVLVILILSLICILYDKPFFNVEAIAILIFTGAIYAVLMGIFSAYYLWHKRKIFKEVDKLLKN